VSFLKRYILIRALALPAIAAVGTILFLVAVVVCLLQARLENERAAEQRIQAQDRYEQTLAKSRLLSMQLRSKFPTHPDRLRDFYQLCMEINPGQAAACRSLIERYDRMYRSAR
jgi:hypothetical protein